MRRALIGAFVFTAILSGCSVHVHQHDPLTVSALHLAVEHRESDYEQWRVTMERAKAGAEVDSTALEVLRVRNEAELGRLRAALAYERSKEER